MLGERLTAQQKRILHADLDLDRMRKDHRDFPYLSDNEIRSYIDKTLGGALLDNLLHKYQKKM